MSERPSTYLDHAKAEADEVNGRFARRTPTSVTGATAVPEVPKLAPTSWSNQILPNEAPLGHRREQMSRSARRRVARLR